MGLAQNYQDSLLFWAKQLIEFDSLRKIVSISPFQILRTTVPVADFDFLPFVANRTYLISYFSAGVAGTFTTASPIGQFNNAFINTIELQKAFSSLNAGAVINQFDSLLLTSRVRYANNGAAGAGGASSWQIGGYIIDYTV